MFVTVAEERSFTKAAKRLGVSPSAVSHSMRELEAKRCPATLADAPVKSISTFTLAKCDMNPSDQPAALLERLVNLETELHKGETRGNAQRMEALLHRDFVEFGRSGNRYNRADVLNEFGTDSALPAIHSDHWDLVILAEGVVLLTYLSAHVDPSGDVHRHALRSSIWVSTELRWQMRFHQGTPTTVQSSING